MRLGTWSAAVFIFLVGAGGPWSGPRPVKNVLKLYVTSSRGDDITVIDPGTMRVAGDIKVGVRVHGLAAQADGQRLFTTIESEHNLKIIDTTRDRIIATIPLTGRPNQCAVTPDGRFVGVPIRDSNSVDIVDVSQKKVVKVLPLKVPHNCLNAGNNDHLWVSSMGDHRINLVDLPTLRYIAEIPVGGVPRPFAVTPDEKTLFVALSDLHGFVIIDVGTERVLETIKLPFARPRPHPLEPDTPTHGLALAPDGRELWVTSLDDDGVYVYDLARRSVSKRIPVGQEPNWLALSPDGRYCAVSNSGSDDCSIIDTKKLREVARLKVGKVPKRLLFVTVAGPN